MNKGTDIGETPGGTNYRIPIHWYMLISLCVTAVIIVAGIFAVSGDQNTVLGWGRRNITELNRSADRVDRLLSRQIPLRKLVEEQRIRVNRFAYEFDLFVAREIPDITALENALNEMVDHYYMLERRAGPDFPKDMLVPLRENILMAVGLFEEASEFRRVGFGEMHRLAEESQEAVYILLEVMSALEIFLDREVSLVSREVNREIKETTDNTGLMFRELNRMAARNQGVLWAVLIISVFTQGLFLYIFRQRIFNFSRLTRYISRHGDLSLRVTGTPEDDLGRLASSFNDMMDNLEKTSRSMAFLEDIMESMDDAVLVLSGGGVIEQANSHACLLLTRPMKFLVGKQVAALFAAPVPELQDAVSRGDNTGPWEYLYKKPDGKDLHVLVSVTNLATMTEPQDTGKQLCIVRDISPIKKMEREKIRAEKIALEKSKYALIGQVAGKMAHDFNNVLGIIMGNTELTLMDCPEGEVKETLTLVFDQAVRGKNLTRNLVAFAKAETPRQEFFSVPGIIDQVLLLLKKDLAGIEVIREDAAALPDLFADPGMIEHALVNLLQNAVHALSLTPTPRIRIRTYAKDRLIRIDVADNGCGIPEAYLERIFDPSFTLKGSRDKANLYDEGIKGTGYGLANVKKYIDQHHGEIRVVNNPDGGALFTISLPEVVRKAGVVQPESEVNYDTIKGKRILLVEDEKNILNVQSRLLSRAPGYHEVETATTASQAVAMLTEGSYDLISLDYILKDGSSGMDVYTFIRKSEPAVPVLFVSGNLEFLESVASIKEQDPLLDHLTKPYKGQVYLDAVNRLIARAQRTTALQNQGPGV